MTRIVITAALVFGALQFVARAQTVAERATVPPAPLCHTAPPTWVHGQEILMAVCPGHFTLGVKLPPFTKNPPAIWVGIENDTPQPIVVNWDEWIATSGGKGGKMVPAIDPDQALLRVGDISAWRKSAYEASRGFSTTERSTWEASDGSGGSVTTSLPPGKDALAAFEAARAKAAAALEPDTFKKNTVVPGQYLVGIVFLKKFKGNLIAVSLAQSGTLYSVFAPNSSR